MKCLLFCPLFLHYSSQGWLLINSYASYQDCSMIQVYFIQRQPIIVNCQVIVLNPDDRQRRKFLTTPPSENFLTKAQVIDLGLILVLV